jgi:hypothetical protein
LSIAIKENPQAQVTPNLVGFYSGVQACPRHHWGFLETSHLPLDPYAQESISAGYRHLGPALARKQRISVIISYSASFTYQL